MMNVFYLLVGSNINKRYHIKQCHKLLQQLTQVVAFSSVYETAAVGSNGEVVEQESYYNLAYELKSPMSVREFKQNICQSIEVLCVSGLRLMFLLERCLRPFDMMLF